MYFRARFYDTTTGEFASRDPLEYVDGMSMMRGYMGLDRMDSLGLSSRLVGEDSEGRPIIQVVSDSKGIWEEAGLELGDCFVWDKTAKKRIKIDCPKDLCHTNFEKSCALGERIDDLGPTCFCEGFNAHCVNSCLVQYYLVFGGLTQAVAKSAGHDWWFDSRRQECDIEANQTGINIANEYFKTDTRYEDRLRTCLGRCNLAFFAKFNKECCSYEQPTVRKDEPGCKCPRPKSEGPICSGQEGCGCCHNPNGGGR